MSYMYGKRGTCKETPLTAAIRGELYTQSYDSIDWNAARNQCAKEDLYYPHPKVFIWYLPISTEGASSLAGKVKFAAVAALELHANYIVW